MQKPTPKNFAVFVAGVVSMSILIIYVISNRQKASQTSGEVPVITVGPSPPKITSWAKKTDIQADRELAAQKNSIDQYLEETKPSVKRNLYLKLLPSLSNEQAIELVEHLPVGIYYDSGLRALTQKLLDSDPESAKNWLLGLRSDASTAAAFSSFGEHYIKRSPDDALAFSQKIIDSGKRNKYLGMAVYHLAASDPEKALRWASENISAFLSPDIAYSQILKGATPEFAQKHLDLIESKTIRDQVAARFNTEHSPPPHSDLAAPTPMDPMVQDFKRTFDDDPITASEKLGQEIPSTQKDEKISYLIDKIRFRQPKEALIWSLAIQDESLKEAALRKIAAGYVSEDLTETIHGLELDEKLKSELLSLHQK